MEFQNAVQNSSVWAAGVIFIVYHLLTLFDTANIAFLTLNTDYF